jgi:hypothetical protein
MMSSCRALHGRIRVRGIDKLELMLSLWIRELMFFDRSSTSVS